MVTNIELTEQKIWQMPEKVCNSIHREVVL